MYEFQQENPLVKINLEISDRIPNIEEEDIDVITGFSAAVFGNEQLRQREIFAADYILCAAPSYLKKLGVPRSPKDLEKHKLINHPFRHPINQVEFASGEKVFMPTPEFVINNIFILKMLAVEGAGIFQTVSMQVEAELQSGTLVQVLSNFPMNKVQVQLYYKPSKYQVLKVQCFIDFLLDRIK